MMTRARRNAVLALSVSVIATVAVGASNAERTWAGILIASYGLLGIGLGGLFFVALNQTCGATWASAIRRVPEAMASVLPFGAAGVLAVLFLHPSIYPWISQPEPLHGFKGMWLEPTGFRLRALVYVACWLVFARAIVNTSRAQDHGGNGRLTRRFSALSVAFVVIFALTFWLASFDWIMSLEPHWASTIFGIYNFAGLFASALALTILLVLGVRRADPGRFAVRDEHLHDLGKLLFAFSTFWMYIWFSQYMLIWYSNIPEEATYFVRRRTDAWLPLFYLNVALNWCVPFIALISRAAKRGRILALTAVTVLLGRVLDLYLMIGGAVSTGAPAFGIPEVAPLVAAGALFAIVFSRAFAAASPVPLQDPGLAFSLSYDS